MSFVDQWLTLRIHATDLETLFAAYDELFFGCELKPALRGRPVTFRLSKRMTKAGGTTTRFKSSKGEVRFEIAIAVSMLFDQFRDDDAAITVCGIECTTRLQALQRTFEHELIHLVEQLCWGDSACSAPRFQSIALGRFGHQAHTHAMITRKVQAAAIGIRVGALVSFLFEGQRLNGRVNRITKRATVLVEHPEGVRYSNSMRYRAYYVPIGALEPAKRPSV